MKLRSFMSLPFLSVSLLAACASTKPQPALAKSTDNAPAAAAPTRTSQNNASQNSAAQNSSTLEAANQAAKQPASQEARFAAWKRDFTDRASAKGYDRAMVQSLLATARINEKALDRDRTQPEFSKPIWSYVKNAVTTDRLNGGKQKLAENNVLYQKIEGRYRVSQYYLTAIWGLESAYGKIQGSDDIVSSLSTFAFEGRRSKFGEQQLFAILDLVKDKKVRPEQLKGSWAGAMGMMQFIPTTFRDYAVDFDSNGNIDMWHNNGDALGSAAHYLSRYGWQWGQPAMAEVSLPQGFDYSLSDGRKMSTGQWARKGVRPAGKQNWSQAAAPLEAKLLVPAGHKGPKFLTYKNFDVIKRYNNSTSYAMGITSLAMALNGKAAIRTPWPEGDVPLSLTDKKNLQQRLTNMGYDTNGVDGKIGPNSLKAIRAWQGDHGHIEDGYVEQSLFRKIMQP